MTGVLKHHTNFVSILHVYNIHLLLFNTSNSLVVCL